MSTFPKCALLPVISLLVIIGTENPAVDLGSPLSGSTRSLKRQRNLITISGHRPPAAIEDARVEQSRGEG